MSDDHSLDSALTRPELVVWDEIPFGFVQLDADPRLDAFWESGSGLIGHCPHCGQRVLAVQNVRVDLVNNQADVSP